jgi:hypothetical protein
MLALTSIFVLARVAVQVSKRRALELPDFFIYLSYILYIALWYVGITIYSTPGFLTHYVRLVGAVTS